MALMQDSENVTLAFGEEGVNPFDVSLLGVPGGLDFTLGLTPDHRVHIDGQEYDSAGHLGVSVQTVFEEFLKEGDGFAEQRVDLLATVAWMRDYADRLERAVKAASV